MGNKLNLDKLDLQIIHEMMANAEISYADLGAMPMLVVMVLVRFDFRG